MVLSIMLFLVSCLPSTTEVDFRSGRDGVSVEITGPEKITLYSGSPLPVEVYDIKVENKGATDLNNDDIYMRIKSVGDFLKPKEGTPMIVNSVSELSGQSMSVIEGKNIYSNKGDFAYHYATFTAYPDEVSTTVDVDLCYRYKTVLSDSICINTIKHKEGGCVKDKYTYSSGQGAPVVVQKVEVGYIPQEDGVVIPKLMITIDNNDGGIVTLPDKFKEGCTAQEDINRLKIGDVKLGNQDLDCGITDKTLLIDEEKTITCTLSGIQPESPEGYYDTTIYVELEYGFHTSDSINVDIVKEK